MATLLVGTNKNIFQETVTHTAEDIGNICDERVVDVLGSLAVASGFTETEGGFKEKMGNSPLGTLLEWAQAGYYHTGIDDEAQEDRLVKAMLRHPNMPNRILYYPEEWAEVFAKVMLDAGWMSNTTNTKNSIRQHPLAVTLGYAYWQNTDGYAPLVWVRSGWFLDGRAFEA